MTLDPFSPSVYAWNAFNGQIRGRRPSVAGLIAVAVLAFPSSAARAGIIEVGGSVAIAEPPLNIAHNQWESDTQARLWLERATLLGGALAVDAVNSGAVFPGGTPGTIPALTEIASYMLRTDPVASHDISLEGYVVFDQPILGVIFRQSRLNDTDALLGRPNVSYNHNNLRGLEPGFPK